VAIVRGLLRYDPEAGASAAPALIVALNRAGQFQAALDFIPDGPADSRADWTTATFRRWSESAPQAALQALDSLPDPQLRADAFHALVEGWSASNPSALAGYAVSLPGSQDRTYALNQAMDNWSLQDPAALASWLATGPSGVDYDQAIGRLIGKVDTANVSSDVAMEWVETMANPDLKYAALARVLGQWQQADAAAAQNYVANASWIEDAKRQELLKSFPPGVAASPGLSW
jgi:hypothetical protein